ncbi:MAG: T9SS type A sorting domain-containing protein [Flavobacteriales bacterium]|nr:T9SS type A sorting domain-containing protein [Flavobacteriales bacterium]
MKKLLYSLLFVIPSICIAQELDFTDASDLLPSATVSDHAIGVVDMNGDGMDDIIRMESSGTPGNSTQTVFVALQQGAGEDFVNQIIGTMEVSGTGSADAWGMCVADVDENGMNDLITGGFYNGVYVFKANNDASAYTAEIELNDEIFVQGMSALDIDNDGMIDFFICDDNDISQILTNDGTGNLFEIASGLVPETDDPSDNSGNYGTVFTDVDNNGYCDLYISKCRQGVTDNTDPRRINQLFMNNGDGTWTSEGVTRGVAIGAQSWSADFGDYDNDGDFDLFVGNHDTTSDFLINDGDGNFTEVTSEADLESNFPFLVIQTSWVDFNNDGFIDLLAMGNGNHTVAMNNGDGTFETYDEFFGDFPVNSYALGDLNNDGSIDLYVTANGYGGWGNEIWQDRIFLNNGNGNNWIKVNLTGVESNLNGIGARISIYGPWGVQMREVKAGESYGIQNSLTQHFGLGTNNVIDQMTVTWPSGQVDNFYNVDINDQISIVEGSSAVSVDELNMERTISSYPNPVVDIVSIQLEDFDKLDADDVELRIHNSVGKIICIEQVTDPLIELDLSDLSGGLYTYSLTADSKLIGVKKFVKQ